MERGLFALREEARRLEDDFRAEVLPGQLRRVALVEEPELVVAGPDDALGNRHFAIERPEYGVVLEEVSHRVGITEVVDRDQIDVGSLVAGTPPTGRSFARSARTR